MLCESGHGPLKGMGMNVRDTGYGNATDVLCPLGCGVGVDGRDPPRGVETYPHVLLPRPADECRIEEDVRHCDRV